MICPKCGKDNNIVMDSRESNDSVIRRRKCLSCEYRFTTYEKYCPNAQMLSKITGNGRREIMRLKLQREGKNDDE